MQRKKLHKWVLRGALLSPLMALFFWGGMNATGFCWTEKRWLSDEEKIDRVLMRVNNATSVNIYATEPLPGNSVINEYKTFKIIPYQTLALLRAANTNCCNISKVRINSPYGFAMGEQMEINLAVNYLTMEKGEKKKKLGILATYDNCVHSPWLSHELNF